MGGSIISLETIVTDVLAIFGLALIIFSPLYFLRIQNRVLKKRLHTKIDGEKLFEKLKYDLKVPKLTGINKKRLYKDIDYAKTIFNNAMDYNYREFVWYFNELGAKKFIYSTISKKAWLHFWVWIATILIIIGGSYFDFFYWLLEYKKLNNTSGKVSIWILFIMAFVVTSLTKYIEFNKVKIVINDEVRQINLTKKEKVWKDYKIIFWISCVVPFLGFILIIINFFF